MNDTTPVIDPTFDWLTPADPPPADTPVATVIEPQPPRRTGWKRKVSGIAAAIALVGAGTAVVVDHSSGSTAATAANAGPGGAAGAVGGPGAAGAVGGPGFSPTAYHVSGTITALTASTVTIKSSTGTTTTYTVTSSTHLMSGSTTATLSAFKVGDSVNASTTTEGGTVLNDMVTGMGARGAGGGGAPPAA